MTRRSLALGLAALALSALFALADIDVNVPPGLPPEWMRFLPRPTLTDLGRVPLRREGGQKTGSVESLPTGQERPTWGERIDTPFGFSGITTVDLPDHFPWSVPKTPTKTGEISGPGADLPTSWRYPPPFPTHLYWLAVATLMRKPIHPALVSKTATIEHLIALGEPAWMAAAGARTEGALAEIARAVEQAVGPLPLDQPQPRGGINPYQKMIYRLALAELSSGYPYGPDKRFARRLMSLGQEALAPVLDHTKHPHRFVRRNAVALLAVFDLPQAGVRLRELAADSDRVVRNRALAALADRRDPHAVPLLLNLLKAGDPGTRVLAADALGQIGDPRAVAPLVAWAQAAGNDADVLWSAIPALGRIGAPDKAALAALRALELRLRDNPRLFHESPGPNFMPPVPDPITRAQVLAQMCRIARAAMGEAESAGSLLDEIAGKAGKPGKAPKDPLRAQLLALRRGMLGRRGTVLLGIASPNLFFVCDALGRMGARGNQALLDAIGDATEDAAVRAHAVTRLQITALHTFLESMDKLAELARSGDSGLVRARALELLEDLDPESAVEAARRIVLDYSVGQPSYESMRQEWVVIPAMRLLGRRASNDVGVLLQVIQRAQREQEEGEIQRQKAQPRINVQRGNVGGVPLVTVPPVLEAALIELGRTGSDKAVAPLAARLADTQALGRPEAALALGAIGGKPVLAKLADALADADPWVRLAAYQSLRRLAPDADFFCDWIFEAKGAIDDAAAKWKAWVKKQP